MALVDALLRVENARRTRDAAQQELVESMSEAKEAGFTYREIAVAADCTHEWVRQTVHRFWLNRTFSIPAVDWTKIQP